VVEGRLARFRQPLSAGLVVALTAGSVAIALVARTSADLSDLGTALALGILLTASLVFVRPPLGETVMAFVRTRGWIEVGSYREVEVALFTDPRKGEGAEFLRLWIANEVCAAEFARRNPQAIPEATWNGTYRTEP
jgi:hypothetical protein